MHASPTPDSAAESRRCRDQAAAQSPGNGAESQRCDSSSAESTERPCPDTRPQRRVMTLQRPGGCAETRRRRVPAVLLRSADTRPLRRVQALQRPGGAESRRLRVPAMLTQAAPSPCSADTNRLRRVMALQRPGGCPESGLRRVAAVLPRSADTRQLR